MSAIPIVLVVSFLFLFGLVAFFVVTEVAYQQRTFLIEVLNEESLRIITNGKTSREINRWRDLFTQLHQVTYSQHIWELICLSNPYKLYTTEIQQLVKEAKKKV